MLLSRRDISQARHALTRAMRDSDPKSMQRRVGNAVEAVEVGASAFAFGVLKGRWLGVKLGPVPVDAMAAGVLHLLGFSGLAGDATEHLHNFANGALASYLSTLGAGLGDAAAAKKGAPSVSGSRMGALPYTHKPRWGGLKNARSMSGALPPGQAPLSAQELAAMARMARRG